MFRISTGAIPFLMPLMLQLGFGLNAFQSGLITFSGAIGALTVKFIARRTFALTGFRTTLIWAASLGAVMTAVNGFFTPDTPHILIILSLLVGGLCRSFFFTGTNALAYSEVSDQQASQATSMSSVFQQVSLALGVAFAAFILEISSFVSGTELTLSDFIWPSSLWPRFRSSPSGRWSSCRPAPVQPYRATEGHAKRSRRPANKSKENKKGGWCSIRLLLFVDRLSVLIGITFVIMVRVIVIALIPVIVIVVILAIVSQRRGCAAALEVLGEQEHLDRFLTRRARLDVDDLLEVLLQHVEQIFFRAALEGLGKEMPARPQNLDGEVGCHFAEMHGAQVVGLLVAGRRGRHVGDDEIRRAADRFHQKTRRFRIKEVELQDFYARQRCHFEKIDGGDADVLVRHFVTFAAICDQLPGAAPRSMMRRAPS